MTREKLLVTGGTGFIGRHLVAILAAGADVYVTGREAVPKGSELLTRDFRVVGVDDLRQFACVWHLAAETDTRAPDAQQWEVNAHDAADFLIRCREAGIAKPVYASSCAVYGRAPEPFREDQDPEPLNAYGAAKAALDAEVSKWAVGIRPSNVFGPGEEHKGYSASMVGQIVANVRDRREVRLFRRCMRDLVSVHDVALILAMARHFAPGCYNAGTGVAVDYVSVATEAAAALGRVPRTRRIDCPGGGGWFQESTRVSMLKTATALQAQGLAWQPTYWRKALRESIASGWPAAAEGWPDPSPAQSSEPAA